MMKTLFFWWIFDNIWHLNHKQSFLQSIPDAVGLLKAKLVFVEFL